MKKLKRQFFNMANYVSSLYWRLVYLVRGTKINLVFKIQKDLSNVFHFNDCLLYDLPSRAVYKFQCGRCNSCSYGDTDRHLKVRPSEYTGISSLTFDKIKPSVQSFIRRHILFRDHSSSFMISSFQFMGPKSFY